MTITVDGKKGKTPASIDGERIEIIAKVVPSAVQNPKTEREAKEEFNREELRTLKLTGLPLSIEHKDEWFRIGKITHDWVAEDGAKYVRGKFYNTINALFAGDSLCKRYFDVSLKHAHYFWNKPDGSAVSVKKPIEVSLCKKGKRDGSEIVAVKVPHSYTTKQPIQVEDEDMQEPDAVEEFSSDTVPFILYEISRDAMTQRGRARRDPDTASASTLAGKHVAMLASDSVPEDITNALRAYQMSLARQNPSTGLYEPEKDGSLSYVVTHHRKNTTGHAELLQKLHTTVPTAERGMGIDLPKYGKNDFAHGMDANMIVASIFEASAKIRDAPNEINQNVPAVKLAPAHTIVIPGSKGIAAMSDKNQEGAVVPPPATTATLPESAEAQPLVADETDQAMDESETVAVAQPTADAENNLNGFVDTSSNGALRGARMAVTQFDAVTDVAQKKQGWDRSIQNQNLIMSGAQLSQMPTLFNRVMTAASDASASVDANHVQYVLQQQQPQPAAYATQPMVMVPYSQLQAGGMYAASSIPSAPARSETENMAQQLLSLQNVVATLMANGAKTVDGHANRFQPDPAAVAQKSAPVAHTQGNNQRAPQSSSNAPVRSVQQPVPPAKPVMAAAVDPKFEQYQEFLRFQQMQQQQQQAQQQQHVAQQPQVMYYPQQIDPSQSAPMFTYGDNPNIVTSFMQQARQSQTPGIPVYQPAHGGAQQPNPFNIMPQQQSQQQHQAQQGGGLVYLTPQQIQMLQNASKAGDAPSPDAPESMAVDVIKPQAGMTAASANSTRKLGIKPKTGGALDAEVVDFASQILAREGLVAFYTPGASYDSLMETFTKIKGYEAGYGQHVGHRGITSCSAGSAAIVPDLDGYDASDYAPYAPFSPGPFTTGTVSPSHSESYFGLHDFTTPIGHQLDKRAPHNPSAFFDLYNQQLLPIANKSPDTLKYIRDMMQNTAADLQPLQV